MKEFSKSLATIINVYNLYMAEKLKQFNLGLSDYSILLYLFGHPDTLLCQNEIARLLTRDKALIARATRTLVRLGYVYIMSDPHNKLKKNLFLTEKGLEIVPQIKSHIAKWDEEILLKILPEERELFESMIDRICSSSEALYNELF